MLKRRPDLWGPSYLLSSLDRLRGRQRRARTLTHIVFLVCDHFEPRHGATRPEQPAERLQTWHAGFSDLQRRCADSFGTRPLHTWFYPPHHGLEHLAALSEMVFEGLGEVELHYHHQNDTQETLRRDLTQTIADFQSWGFLLASGMTPQTRFGFIHGDWALDNSCGGRFCGVDNELSVLQSLGCWGDMTMPSVNSCQTRKINSVYYAEGRDGHSKSHDWGPDARVGKTDQRGLFLLQGPLGINWRADGRPRLENGSLTSANWGRPDRVRAWLDANVHVRGRPEWQFIKLHTHGALERDFDALFGEKAFALHRVIHEHYNDARHFRVHYVTARQAYNIARAAEHGHGGDPSDYLDFEIPPPPHHFYTCDARHRVLQCSGTDLRLDSISLDRETHLRTRLGPIPAVRGRFHTVAVDGPSNTVTVECGSAGTGLVVSVEPDKQLRVSGGEAVEEAPGLWRVTGAGRIGMSVRAGQGRLKANQPVATEL